MKNQKSAGDFSELSRRANSLGAEAEWSVEELRIELRQDGVDPDRLVKNVVSRLKDWRNDSSSEDSVQSLGKQRPSSLPLVNQLRRYTGLTAAAVAHSLDVPLVFLSLLERHAGSVPQGWRTELSKRAQQKLGVTSDVVMSALDYTDQLRPAALRDSSPPSVTLSYEEMLAQSGMDEAARQFWRHLAEQP